MVAASKVPMLKPGEYELWRTRMEQYIQMIDYSLWEVIENGNAPPITKVVDGVETIIAFTTAEEKAQRRLLRREVLDQNFDRVQKLISQLEIHGESISHEDPEIDTLSLDDLYNNLKIYEPEVKGTSSISTNTQNVAFVSSNSTSSTNGAVNTAHGATTASTQATAVNLTTIDNLSDAVICAFFANGYAKNEGKEILKEHWKEVFCECTGIQGTKKTRIGRTQEGLCQWRQLLLIIGVCEGVPCLESVEARLLVYKKNESVYEEEVKVLKYEIHLREVAITELRRKLELAKKEKDEIQLTVENFENSSKSLSKLIDCQIVDKCKNVVPPPYTGTCSFFKCLQFELPGDVVNKTLRIILELQFFKSSLFDLCSNYSSKLFSNTSYQQHLNSYIDYMYIKSYSFRLFSSLPAINSGVASPLATRKVHVHGRLKTISTLTVCSGLVNPLAPRKGKFHGGLITISTLCT
ncbi:hypothetical protein Tco_0875934 [Tanacetum coccineum]|uniref:Uncharacterized protein n=1 Tax=Tanacetum coccineum TaxID=301880 RepID=A0ABQ5BSF0_9ASTR